MPRFFFDLHNDGSVAADEEGLELDSVECAEAEAMKTAATMAVDQLSHSPNAAVVIEVLNWKRERVFSAQAVLNGVRVTP